MTAKRPPLNQWTRLILEMGPLVVFFLLNAKADFLFANPPEENIFYATGGFMVATIVSLSASYILVRHLPVMPLVTGVFVMVFGGLTLWLQDDLFIKLKPTLVNTLFAMILLGGLATGRLFLKLLFSGAFFLTEEGWRQLTIRWSLFFIFLALVNEVVWRNFSTDFWVSFKLFGIMPLTMLFALVQIPVLTKYQLEKPGEPDERQ